MQTVFEKIIEKLEEKQDIFLYEDSDYGEGKYNAFDEAIEIVKQKAEKYNVMIDGEYCFQSCGCTEMCGECSRIANGDTDYYENICAFSEQYNNDWIPCSERLPEEAFGCLVTVIDCNPVTLTEFENILPYVVGYDGDGWNDADGERIPFEVIAWQPLPQPYQPKGE